MPRGAGDLLLDLAIEPLYVDPTAIDVSGDWLHDQHFRLMQIAAGQSVAERGGRLQRRDASRMPGWRTARPRTDGAAGQRITPICGYHYPYREAAALTGDCNGDGVVAINELVMAVNIAARATRR